MRLRRSAAQGDRGTSPRGLHRSRLLRSCRPNEELPLRPAHTSDCAACKARSMARFLLTLILSLAVFAGCGSDCPSGVPFRVTPDEPLPKDSGYPPFSADGGRSGIPHHSRRTWSGILRPGLLLPGRVLPACSWCRFGRRGMRAGSVLVIKGARELSLTRWTRRLPLALRGRRPSP